MFNEVYFWDRLVKVDNFSACLRDNCEDNQFILYKYGYSKMGVNPRGDNQRKHNPEEHVGGIHKTVPGRG